MKTKAKPSSVYHFFYVACLLAATIVAALACPPPAGSEVKRIRGQTVYVPVYSDIYHGDREKAFYLAVTLSIRNTDPTHPLTVVSIDYFDSNGKLLRKELDREIRVPPMASTSTVVKESDKAGGAGASFRVVWKSETKICEPLIETVMIGTFIQQGISFTSRGQVVEETP